MSGTDDKPEETKPTMEVKETPEATTEEKPADDNKTEEKTDGAFSFAPVGAAPVANEAPLVTEEVEVKTCEEDEEVLVVLKSKLYRMASECDPPEWKERGTGLVKLLKHKETKKIRVLMRRDKTLKICANHYVHPAMKLEENVSSDRSWLYKTPVDYSDGSTGGEELLAIRFPSVENAQQFKEAFVAAQDEMQAIMDAAPESRMYLILTSAYLLTTSLNFASVWRDRFASRVWKYQVAGPENPHKRINASDFVYHTRNIWRAVEGWWLMILWFIIGVGAVVCLALTMIYLKELAEGDHEAGCGLVSVSIFFYACFAFILAYVLIGPTPHWQKEEEKHMGFLGGVIPIAGFFIIAIGLEVAGILLFKITITQTMCIILGELIMGDAIFNFLKIFFKMKRVDNCITHVVRSVGENHIVHGLKGGESIKDRMIRAPTDGLQKLFPGGGGHGH